MKKRWWLDKIAYLIYPKSFNDTNGDYYYFRKGVNGKEPSNYRSYFGGSTCEPVHKTDLYYLHAFAKEQPDFN
ncbi:Oligo-1,6-glucosidase [Clostridium sp. C105KSO13]|nr:Oligo-1,6-glucosidase [Clostridium sp. C105KSO13]